MELVVNANNAIAWQRPLTDQYTFHIVAQEVRRERTGLHGQISLSINTTLLAYDTFNIGRQEDRTRLANSAHGHFKDGLEDGYPKEHLKHDLDLFCLALPKVWEEDRFEVCHYDAEEEVPPLRHILVPFIIEGGGTIVFAPPGTGKSYTCMAMAASIASGITRLWPVERRPVLYLNLERSGDSMRRRFRWIAAALGINGRDHTLEFLHAKGHPFKSLSRRVAKWVAEHPNGIGVADSISRAGMGSLVADDTANSIIDWLHFHFGSWLAVGHTTRASDEHTYGSIHFDAGEDVGVKLMSEQRDDGTMGVALTVVKANDMRTGQTTYIALRFKDDRLTEIRQGKENEFPNLLDARGQTNLEKVLAYMNEVGHSNATTVAQKTGVPRPKVSALFGTDLFVRLGRDGREVTYGLARVTPKLPSEPEPF